MAAVWYKNVRHLCNISECRCACRLARSRINDTVPDCVGGSRKEWVGRAVHRLRLPGACAPQPLTAVAVPVSVWRCQVILALFTVGYWQSSTTMYLRTGSLCATLSNTIGLYTFSLYKLRILQIIVGNPYNILLSVSFGYNDLNTISIIRYPINEWRVNYLARKIRFCSSVKRSCTVCQLVQTPLCVCSA